MLRKLNQAKNLKVYKWDLTFISVNKILLQMKEINEWITNISPFSYARWINSRSLPYNIAPVVDNIVLCNLNVCQKVDLMLSILTRKKEQCKISFHLSKWLFRKKNDFPKWMRTPRIWYKWPCLWSNTVDILHVQLHTRVNTKIRT